jgi:hypothetical protein
VNIKKESMCQTKIIGKTEFTPIVPGTFKIMSGGKVIAEDSPSDERVGYLCGKGIHESSTVEYSTGDVYLIAKFFLQLKDGIVLSYSYVSAEEQKHKTKPKKIVKQEVPLKIPLPLKTAQISGIEYPQTEEKILQPSTKPECPF